MNTPIISPYLFYLLNVLDSLGNWLAIILSFVFTFIIVLLYIICIDNNSEEIKKAKKYLKFSVIFFIAGLVIDLFIPSKETIIDMVIAKNITYERLNDISAKGKDVHKTLKKDIIDIIKVVDNYSNKTSK